MLSLFLCTSGPSVLFVYFCQFGKGRHFGKLKDYVFSKHCPTTSPKTNNSIIDSTCQRLTRETNDLLVSLHNQNPLRAAMAGLLKKTTGLVGLAVSQNPHERLRILYTKLLGSLQAIPQDAAYRKYTEQIVNERFHHVKTEPDVEKLEQKINCGQIEEVIAQAEHELALSRKMAEWKPWEPLIEEPPPNQWKWPI